MPMSDRDADEWWRRWPWLRSYAITLHRTGEQNLAVISITQTIGRTKCWYSVSQWVSIVSISTSQYMEACIFEIYRPSYTPYIPFLKMLFIFLKLCFMFLKLDLTYLKWVFIFMNLDLMFLNLVFIFLNSRLKRCSLFHVPGKTVNSVRNSF